MTFSRGFRSDAGDAGAFLRSAARVTAAALMVGATPALLWAAPAAAASGARARPGASTPPSASASPSASVSPSAAGVKYLIVPPAANGQTETLSEIAAATLGSAARSAEIFDLNKGRLQPGGGRLESPGAIKPGWIIELPAGAHGPGVRFGPLPGTAAPAASLVSAQRLRAARTASAAAFSGAARTRAISVGVALMILAAAGLAVSLRRRAGSIGRRRRPRAGARPQARARGSPQPLVRARGNPQAPVRPQPGPQAPVGTWPGPQAPVGTWPGPRPPGNDRPGFP
jgi:hypothetical protein